MYQKIITLILVSLLAISSTPLSWRALGEVQLSSTDYTDKIRSREKIIGQTLSSASFVPFTKSRLDISIDTKLIEPRGRMKWRSIILSALVDRDSEFLKLFVHEFAHFVDIYVLVREGKTPDISLDFYNISWQSASIKKAWQKQPNFISWYAATNQYEDFAESLVFYVFHNRVFEERAMRDDIIREKYLFFRNSVFPSGVFVDSDYSLGRVPGYTWDTTKLPISLQKYLYSLN